MKKFFFLILIFLASCSAKKIENDFNFSNQMSLKEFKIKLEEYTKNNSFPNIDD